MASLERELRGGLRPHDGEARQRRARQERIARAGRRLGAKQPRHQPAAGQALAPEHLSQGVPDAPWISVDNRRMLVDMREHVGLRGASSRHEASAALAH